MTERFKAVYTAALLQAAVGGKLRRSRGRVFCHVNTKPSNPVDKWTAKCQEGNFYFGGLQVLRLDADNDNANRPECNALRAQGWRGVSSVQILIVKLCKIMTDQMLPSDTSSRHRSTLAFSLGLGGGDCHKFKTDFLLSC